MLTWEAQRPNSCGSSRKEALPGPGKHSFDPHPQTQETGQFLAERFLSKTFGINFVAGVSPGWRLQRRMLACGRLCPTTSQRSRSRSSRRPWTEPSRFGLPSISSQMNEGKKDKSVWPAQWLASPSCGRPAPNLSPVCQVSIFSEICVEKYVPRYDENTHCTAAKSGRVKDPARVAANCPVVPLVEPGGLSWYWQYIWQHSILIKELSWYWQYIWQHSILIKENWQYSD